MIKLTELDDDVRIGLAEALTDWDFAIADIHKLEKQSEKAAHDVIKLMQREGITELDAGTLKLTLEGSNLTITTQPRSAVQIGS